MFARLGPWCHDNRKRVLIFWIAALVLVNGISGIVGNGFRDEFNLPDVESKKGFEILEDDFDDQQGTGFRGSIVFRYEPGVRDPAVQAAMQDLFAKVEATEVVDVRLTSPYEPGGERQTSRDGQIAFAEIEVPDDTDFTQTGKVRDLVFDEAPDIDGLQVELGGGIFGEFEPPSSEALGLGFAIVILIVAFGSVLAMGLPVGVAMFGIGVGLAITTLLSNLMPVPEFATYLGVMIGLGVGIDYALLIVTRYREQLHAGHTVRDSITIALDTAGRSVLFAGTTVVISLLGMVVMGVRFVQGLAVSASGVVAVTVLASLTLLPALLAFAGERIELTRWRGLVAAGLVAVALVGLGAGISPLLVGAPLAVVVLVAGFFVASLQREVRHRPPKPLRETTAYRWSRVIQHRPWTAALGGGLALLVLAVPVLSLRLGFSDESNFAEDTTTRKAYDLMVEGFGAGFNGPLILAARLPQDVDFAEVFGVTGKISADPAVAFATPPQTNSADNATAVRWIVFPKTGPQEEATTDLVRRLRSDVLPSSEAALGTQIFVSGFVAGNVDFSDLLASRLPYFFAIVLLLSFLLLMVVFRSVLVPLKAVVMNLLSIGAAYGIVVALFQWGWLSDITQVQPGPVEPWAPMMLFAIVFGLSMDYEVFLLSRVREEWHRSGDSRASVADGLAATAKVITAAAAIMVVVFGSFLLEADRTLKLMGTGLATAILLDATIVRMLLVPATMELLGDRNWWLPRWLDRLLPNIDVEGHAEVPVEQLEDEREPVLTGG